jgi:RHS repeat-associated protein
MTTVETYYAWDGGMTLAEYSPSGADALTWQKSFIYLGGRLLATESGAGTYQYHHPDRLGTRLITDSSGGIISEQIHLPYGTALSGESTNYGSPDNPSKKRFTSYERSDGTKLDHAVNRQYHSGLGRFTQVDPIGMSASSLSDPQTLNLYAYCGNDPINHTDPDGLDGGTSITLVVVIQVISAIFSALRALFGGKHRVAVKVQGRFFRETASISVWLEPSVGSGVGAVAIQANKEDKKRRPKLKQKQKKTDADIKRDREAQTEVDDYDPESVRKSAIALAGLAGGTYMVVEYLINQYNESGVDDRIIKCQVAQESKFNPTATGLDKDIGLLQVLPATAKQLGFTP